MGHSAFVFKPLAQLSHPFWQYPPHQRFGGSLDGRSVERLLDDTGKVGRRACSAAMPG